MIKELSLKITIHFNIVRAQFLFSLLWLRTLFNGASYYLKVTVIK